MSAVIARYFLSLSLRHAKLAMFLAFVTCASALRGQTTLSGTSVADPAGPTIISPSAYSGPSYFVLNKDLSISGRPDSQSAQAMVCPPPSGFTPSSNTPRTLLNDSATAYYTAQSSSTGLAASTANNTFPCSSAAPLTFAGGTPTQTFSTNDPRHGRYYVLESFNGNSPDTLTVVNNLNTNSSSTPTLTKASSVTVDTGATYSAMLTDLTSDYGNTVITEMRTSTSPGGLLVYSPGIQTVFRILGPGGVPLPAIGAFFMPSKANDNGQLLVLINQDGITASNSSNPPSVTNPFTIIDLGQLQRAFSAVVSQGTTITLPSVTQVAATKSYYAMLGAVYSPVFHLAYALVAGGTSSSAVTENIIRYDPTNPSAPAETVVADVSNIPFTLGTYPQLALNAAGGSLDILSNGSAYHVSVAGAGNTATTLSGTTFGDPNFQPTFITSNPLLGETYIASSASVDILGLSGSSTKRATFELYGQDYAIANQSYTLIAYGVNPSNDSALTFANVTFTGTPDGGSPVTLGTGQFYQFTGTGTFSTSFKFPAAGIYTVVATVAATTNYPAVTSLPIRVAVGATGIAAVYPTSTLLVVPSTSTATTVTGQLTLLGSTYAPSGRIIVTDANGTQVGRYNFTGGATSYPVNVTLTLPAGPSTLTAVYNGDTQNQTSTSPTALVNVSSLVGTNTNISAPATVGAGATFTANITLTQQSTFTPAPSGNVTLTVTNSATGAVAGTLTYTAAQASASGGYPAQVSLNVAGTYTLSAAYAGDSNYSASSGTVGVTVNPATAVTPSLTLTLPSSARTPGSFPGSILCSETSSATATGNIVITGTSTTGAKVTFATLSAANYCGRNTLPSPITFTSPASATYAVQAVYAGDASFNAASSNVQTIIITVAGPTTTTLNVSAAATVTKGVPFITTITLRPATIPEAQATGNVTISGTASGVTAVYGTVSAADAIAGKQVNITLPTVDTYILTASYAGDANYGASMGSIGVNVTLAKPTLTLTGPATSTGPYNFLVALSGATGTPGGNITSSASLNGSTAVPLTATTLAQSANNTVSIQSNTSFTFTTSGTYTITATYPGDANNGATSATSSLTVTVAIPVVSTGFTIAFDNQSLDSSHFYETPVTVDYNGLEGGGKASVAMTLTSLAGYNSPVTLSVDGIPQSIDASFVDASGATLTSVTPTAAGTHITLKLNNNQYASLHMPLEVSTISYGFGLFGVFSVVLWRKRKQFPQACALLTALCVVALGGTILSGCGTDKTKQQTIVTVTATPVTANAAIPPQSIKFNLVYYVPTSSLPK